MKKGKRPGRKENEKKIYQKENENTELKYLA